MTHRGTDDPRKLREVLARTQALAAEHAVASVVVGFATREGNLLFPDFLSFLESELRVEDQIFRLTRERALLILRDVAVEQARSVVERLREAFEREFPSRAGLDVEIRYLEVPPGTASISVKQVLPAIFGE
jgi:GGDEF domain-containing protein